MFVAFEVSCFWALDFSGFTGFMLFWVQGCWVCSGHRVFLGFRVFSFFLNSGSRVFRVMKVFWGFRFF